MSAITVKSDLRPMFGPVREQGQRPTCLAFAASDLHAAVRGPWSALSCEYIFYHAQRRAQRKPTQGAILPAMLDALRHNGQPYEAGWVYLNQLPANIAQWQPPTGVTPLFRRAGEVGKNTVDAIIAELGQGRPVLTLLRLSMSFDLVKTDGVVDESANEKPDFSRRHAVVSVGHGEVNGQRAILVRNSWGDGWGASGYGWLTEKFLLPRVFQLAMLKEDLSVSPHSAAA